MNFLIIVLLLAGNAFFVGAEFAVITARRDRLEALADKGSCPGPYRDQGVAGAAVADRGRAAGHHAVLAGAGCDRRTSAGLCPGGAPLRRRACRWPWCTVWRSRWRWSSSSHCTRSSARWCRRTSRSPVPNGPRCGWFRCTTGSARMIAPVLALFNAVGRWVLRRFDVEPVDELESAYTPDELALLIGAVPFRGAAGGLGAPAAGADVVVGRTHGGRCAGAAGRS